MEEIYCPHCRGKYFSTFNHICPQNPNNVNYDSYIGEIENIAETLETNQNSARGEISYLNYELLSRAIRLSISLEGDGSSSYPPEELTSSSDVTPSILQGHGNSFDMAPYYSLDNYQQNILDSSNDISANSIDVPFEESLESLFEPGADLLPGPSSVITQSPGNDKEVRFVCNVCCKGFRKKYNFEQHYRTHTGDKPFVCDECGKRFAHKPTLQNHIRIHTGDKPYECGECGKRFRQRDHLRDHIRIHTGDKPYVCGECGDRFARNSTLQNHIRIHTGQKAYQSSVRHKNFA